MAPPPSSSRRPGEGARLAAGPLIVDVALVYAGLVGILLGIAGFIRPLGFLRGRPGAAAIAALGVASVLVGAFVLGRATRRIDTAATELDAVMPAYDFHEVHEVHVRAAPQETYAALLAVTPAEVRCLKQLLGLRALPARLTGGDPFAPLVPAYAIASREEEDPAEAVVPTPRGPSTVTGARTVVVYTLRPDAPPHTPDALLDAYVAAVGRLGAALLTRGDRQAAWRQGAPGSSGTWLVLEVDDGGRRYRLTVVRPSDRTRPLLDVFTSAGFVHLGARPGREVVIGAVNQAWRVSAVGPRPRITGADDFRAYERPGYVKIAANLLVEPAAGGSVVRTETRVLATDAAVRRRFALYWRLIYPGSALIRREWLRAIRLRAEAPSTREAA